MDVKLTPRAVERIEDEYPEGGHFVILGRSRVVFHDPEDAREAADRLESVADQAVDDALAAVNRDLTEAQADMIDRAVRGSIKTATRKLRARADAVEV